MYRDGLVLVLAGMKRTGSTAQFNMVRLIVEEYTLHYNICENYEQLKEGMINIVKRHKFDKRILNCADQVFTSERDLDEIMKSYERFYGKPMTIEQMEDMTEHESKWLKCGGYFYSHFDQLKYNPMKEIADLLRILEPMVRNYLVYLEFIKIKPPKTGQDQKTLLFYNHITAEE